MFELALRSSLVLVGAWILARAMPRATAATRHLIWHCALIATILAPLALFVVPKAFTVPVLPQVPLRPGVLDGQGAEAAQMPMVPAADCAHCGARRSGTLSTLPLLGTLATGLWFILGWLAAGRITRHAGPAPTAWQLEVNALCERFRIAREVRIGILGRHSSPVATGLFRPTILLPSCALTWSDERRQAVLMHEISHIRRRDCQAQLVAQIACALYWFNPLVWLAAAELRREREHACDDAVLQHGTLASSYAMHLLDIARGLRPARHPSAALAMARPSDLEGRLLAVLAAERARVPVPATRWAVVSALTLATVAAHAATTVTADKSLQGSTAKTPVRYVVASDVPLASETPAPPLRRARETLQSSDNPDDRERATLALAFSSGRDVVPALLVALRDTDSQVREKAAIGLALRRDARVVEPLIAAMGDEDSQVREKVAIALGATGDPRAESVLKRALQDSDSQVREKAVAALVLLGLTR